VGAACGIPATAKALSFNVTAIAATAVRPHPRLPGRDPPRPTSSEPELRGRPDPRQQRIVILGAAGDLAFFSGQASGSVHVVLDVNGYFE